MWKPVGVKPAAPPLSSCCCRPALSAGLQYFMSAPKTGFLPARTSGGPSSQAGKQLQHLSLVEGRSTKSCSVSCSRLFVPASAPIHEINKRLKATLKQQGLQQASRSKCCIEEDIQWFIPPQQWHFERHQIKKKPIKLWRLSTSFLSFLST